MVFKKHSSRIINWKMNVEIHKGSFLLTLNDE